MASALNTMWRDLSVTQQDALTLGVLLVPFFLIGLTVLWGFRPLPLVRALIARHKGVAATFTGLIAVAVALGVGLTSQERSLREGSARAAEKFDMVVTARGSDLTMMLAAVYLEPAIVPLLDGETFAAVAAADHVNFAAPIAFGDNYQGAPVVGTTPDFVAHLAGGTLAEGRGLVDMFDAVAGAYATAGVGDVIEPTHGVEDTALEGNNETHGVGYTVTGRLPPTGSPWDRAYLVSVESVWDIHGLGDGHDPGWDGTLGPPFSVTRFPGTPAILVDVDELWAAYALRQQFNTETTMAFFPGAVLARLHGLLGDLRQILSAMALATQALVTVAVLVGLVLITRLLARQLALLRALGAPRRFVFAVTWGVGAAMIVVGAAVGLALGWIAAEVIASSVTRQTEIVVDARLGWRELHLVAGFVSLTSVLALLPAWITMARPVTEDLRG
ncbi:MAG: FtsX-like permease family protein [Pseudomonadota bacterium]